MSRSIAACAGSAKGRGPGDRDGPAGGRPRAARRSPWPGPTRTPDATRPRRFLARAPWAMVPASRRHSMKQSLWNGVALAVGVVLLAVLGPIVVGEVRGLSHPRQLAARAEARIATLDLGGMHCSGCVAGARRELQALPPVSAGD